MPDSMMQTAWTQLPMGRTFQCQLSRRLTQFECEGPLAAACVKVRVAAERFRSSSCLPRQVMASGTQDDQLRMYCYSQEEGSGMVTQPVCLLVTFSYRFVFARLSCISPRPHSTSRKLAQGSKRSMFFCSQDQV